MNGEEEGAEEDADAAAGLDLSLGKKKKKRKPKARTDEEFGALVEDTETAADGDKENEDESLPGQPKLPWDGSDRDYMYQELLGGFLLLCHLQNPCAYDSCFVGSPLNVHWREALRECRPRLRHLAGEQSRADRREATHHHEAATGYTSDSLQL